MQRRAVAVYVALFVVVGVAAGALVATADTPEITFDDPDFELSEGDTFEYDGQTYTVTEIVEERDEDDLGRETVQITATIEWEEVAEQSVQWENDTAVTFDDAEWHVVIEGDDPDAVTLREVIDRQATLEDDPNADNETVESDGQEYVVVRDEDGDATLVPVEEYFPDPEERQFSAGETIDYDGHQATISEITASEATLVWDAPQTMTEELTERGQLTLGDTEFVSVFPDDETVVLSSDLDSYEAQLASIDQFEQQVDGITRIVWVIGAVILSLVAFAFVPSRY